MNLYAVADHAVLADLHVISDLVRADDALLVDVYVVADDHLGVAETPLLLDITRPDNTLFTDDRVDAHGYLGEVAPEHRPRLNDGLAVDEDLLGSLDEHLPTDLVAFGCDEEPFLVVEKGVLFDHHG